MIPDQDVSPQLRSAREAVSCQAQREKASTKLIRRAKECRDRALALMQKADKLERLVPFVENLHPDLEELVWSEFAHYADGH